MGRNVPPRRFSGPNYRAGYTGRDFHVTGGHEAEAEAAEREKKPNRFGMWVLRLLGFRGDIYGDGGSNGVSGGRLPGGSEPGAG